MHISDIEGEYIPRKGDRVRYQVCPMPPRFDKPQAKFLYISRSVRYFYGTGFELVLDWLAVLKSAQFNLLQAIIFEIDCAIFYTNLHELFCQFMS